MENNERPNFGRVQTGNEIDGGYVAAANFVTNKRKRYYDWLGFHAVLSSMPFSDVAHRFTSSVNWQSGVFVSGAYRKENSWLIMISLAAESQ
jgi:cobalamin-dependent methionine synthase I